MTDDELPIRDYIAGSIFGDPNTGPSAKFLGYHEAWRMIDALNGKKNSAKPSVKLTPQSYDIEAKTFQFGGKSISFLKARKEAVVMRLIFENTRRMRKLWDFDEFFETHSRVLNEAHIEKSTQVRSAVNRINFKVRNKGIGFFDLFVLDNGFRLNPRFLHKKQR